jgi:hypothetical protein
MARPPTRSATANRPEKLYYDFAAANDAASKKSEVKLNLRKLMKLFVVALIVSVIALLIIFCCLVALFVETSNLKSETSAQLLQIRDFLSSCEDRLENHSLSVELELQDNEKLHNENMSHVKERLEGSLNLQEKIIEAIVNLHEENILSVEQRLDELEDVGESHNEETQQLNASVHEHASSINRLTYIESFQNSTIEQLNTSLNYPTSCTTLPPLCAALPRPSTCAALPPSSPSGYYWVMTSIIGSAVLVYCDMTMSCGGVTGGWRRVANLDMTNSSHQCPTGLRQRNESNKRTCVKNAPTAGCSSTVTFSTAASMEYSKVCGRVIAYQRGTTDAFEIGIGNINSHYVDGVSLTHGNPRQHIWTFASALDEISTCTRCNCPCTDTDSAALASSPPEFVGNDYFCDTGSSQRWAYIFYGSDPLWDGAGCGPLNTCCSFNNPPWFYKQLPQPTTDHVQMRVCRSESNGAEDIAIETVEIFVQ